MKYRREIDGLRAVALVPVVFSHAGFQWFKGTYVMIDLFFVISGYLITSLIIKEKSQGSFSLIGFYERRARRLLPALFTMMVLSIPFAWFLLFPEDFIQFSKSLMTVPVFSSNFLFWSEADYFQPDTKLKPFLQTWSLSVEEQFYLLFPIIFSSIWPKGRKVTISFLVFISIISIGCMQWGLKNDVEANWYLLPGRIWEFALGAIIALLPERPLENRRESFRAQLLSLSGMMVLLVSVFTFDEYQPFPSLYTLLPIGGTALVIRFADSKNIVGKLLGSKPLVRIGLISYGVFVWHQPLFAFCRHYVLGPISPSIYGLLILLSFILAYLSWNFIETPFRNFYLFKRRTFFTGLLIFSLAFISFGFIGVRQEGFPQRFKIQGTNFDELFSRIRQTKTTTNIKLNEGHCSKTKWKNVEDCIQNWQSDFSIIAKNYDPKIAVFGSSHAGNLTDALQRNGVPVVSLNGSDCKVSPRSDEIRCLKLAQALKDFLKVHPSIQYLVLVPGFRQKTESDIAKLKESLSFWSDVQRPVIIFSGRPEFPFLKQNLKKGHYPSPNFEAADWSLRQEVKDYLSEQGVHLVNSREIFCKITPNCTFKFGERFTFKPEDMLVWDDHHLSPTGAKEFGRILLQTDSVFRKIFPIEF